MAAPCSWTITPSDCDANWASYSPGVQAWATTMAEAVLWASTGRQFGLCPITVRPCGKWDGNAWWGGYIYGSWGGGWGWSPYLWNGAYTGCGCGAGGSGWCSCIPANQIWLPGPVDSVTSVIQAGVTVDPATYRVDDKQWLVALTPNTWPGFQDMNSNQPAANTLTVNFNRGTPVPQAVSNAAGLLASQYAKACSGQDCMLPTRVVSIVRQNVSLHAVDVETLMDKGLTGFSLVDQIIAVYNPFALKGRLRLMSVDQQDYRQ